MVVELTAKSMKNKSLSLLRAFLLPFAIATAAFTLIYILHGGLSVLIVCIIISASYALPYGAAGIVLEIIAMVGRRYERILRSFLSPFLYGGISGVYLEINAQNRLWSYHEQPFKMPPWDDLLNTGLTLGLVCGAIGIVIYFLLKLCKRFIGGFFDFTGQ